MKLQRRKIQPDNREHFKRVLVRAMSEATEEAINAVRAAQGGHITSAGEVTVRVEESEFAAWLVEVAGWKMTAQGAEAVVRLGECQTLAGYENELLAKKAFARGFRQAIFKSTAGEVKVTSSSVVTSPY